MKSVTASLSTTLRHARKTKLYAGRNIPESVKSVAEFERRVPFTTKQDLRSVYPYGGLAVSLRDVIEVHTSSGTTGTPVGSFLTKRDIETGSAHIGEAWKSFGVTDASVVMFAMSYGLFSGAAINTYAIQSLGGFVIPASIISVDRYIDLIMDYGVDMLIGLPGFFYYLHRSLIERDIDPCSTTLRTVIAAGEAYSEETRQEIQRLLKVMVFNHYGLAEINTGIAYECEQQDGLHILDEYVYAEVVDADGQLVGRGQTGQLVLTTLGKEASPVLRYMTGDKVRNLGAEACQCGRQTRKVSRVLGRVDSVVSVKGVKIDPYELRGQLCRQFPDVKDGLMSLRVKPGAIDYTPAIVVSVDDATKRRAIASWLRSLTGLVFEVEHVPISYWFANKTKAPIIEHI
jgi:phenylacetate-CoA ligase